MPSLDQKLCPEWTSRNTGYVEGAVQEKLGGQRILIAGCGLGSVTAELLARTGCRNFVLADGDRVEVHNLNRQLYSHRDIGRNKAEALAERLRAIHPEIQVRAIPEMLTEKNIPSALHGVDGVVDSIDFLDAGAILSLHRQARKAGLPVLSPVAAGWGAAVFLFEPDGITLDELAGMPDLGTEVSYPELFMAVLMRYAETLPTYVSEVVLSQFHKIQNRQPCPVSQLGSGTFCAASLLVSLWIRRLAGQPIPGAPVLLQLDPALHAQSLMPAHCFAH
jgi:molybdopterin/thiamine biosynthesis adenylyltransferase